MEKHHTRKYVRGGAEWVIIPDFIVSEETLLAVFNLPFPMKELWINLIPRKSSSSKNNGVYIYAGDSETNKYVNIDAYKNEAGDGLIWNFSRLHLELEEEYAFLEHWSQRALEPNTIDQTPCDYGSSKITMNKGIKKFDIIKLQTWGDVIGKDTKIQLMGRRL